MIEDARKETSFFTAVMNYAAQMTRLDRQGLVEIANNPEAIPAARYAAVSLVRNIDKRVQEEVDAAPDDGEPEGEHSPATEDNTDA